MDPYQKDEKNEERVQRVAEATRLAGQTLTGPDVRIGNFVLRVIESPNGLHLSRFALCVISHLDKRRFLPAITKLTLADAQEEMKQFCQLWFGNGFSAATVDLIVQHDNNLVNEWITAVGDEHHTAVRAVFFSESLYLSLLETLLRRGDVRAPGLYRNLNRTAHSMRTVSGDSGINVADQALFETRSKTSAVVGLWEEHLARAATDHDLLTLAVLANQGGSRMWLKAKSRALFRSPIARDRAIGITLLGFLEDSEAESVLRGSAKVTRHESERTLIDAAIGSQQKHSWSMHWLDRYWNSRDPDVAHGALILFEGCATRRAWRELHRLIFRSKEAHPHRQRVLDSRRNDIKQAIEANEKDLRDSYLGRKKHSELMAPWSRALFE